MNLAAGSSAPGAWPVAVRGRGERVPTGPCGPTTVGRPLLADHCWPTTAGRPLLAHHCAPRYPAALSAGGEMPAACRLRRECPPVARVLHHSCAAELHGTAEVRARQRFPRQKPTL